MKILWFGIYDENYPRNYILLNGLKQHGVEVVHCQVGAKEKGRYLKLIKKLRSRRGQYDVIYCAFPAQSVVLIAKLFGQGPVVMDAFYSMFDSIVNDRGLHTRFHPKSLWMAFLDWTSVVAADWVIADTKEHADYWGSWLGLSRNKFSVVPIGSDTKYFFPELQPQAGDTFLVQYHGSYIPLQGMDIIVQAAAKLKDQTDITWRFIGSGQLYDAMREQATALGATQIEYIERLPFEEMNHYLNEADVILGIFGQTEKTDRVVPNKVYEGLAVRKPVITKDTEVSRGLLNENEVYYIPRNSDALVEAILELRNNTDKRQQLANAGYQAFTDRFAEGPIAEALLRSFKEAGIKE